VRAADSAAKAECAAQPHRVYAATAQKRPSETPIPSFPRRRESSLAFGTFWEEQPFAQPGQDSRLRGNDGRVGHTWSCRSDSRIRHFSAAPSCRAGVGYKYPTYGSTAAGSLGCKPNIGSLHGCWVSPQATLLKNKFSDGLLSYRRPGFSPANPLLPAILPG